ncbi:MAG: hypothetical protein ACK5RO_07235 [Pseudobdellovibrionaceae bacterium]
MSEQVLRRHKRHLWFSHLAAVFGLLLVMALAAFHSHAGPLDANPVNPATLCDRFVTEKDKLDCQARYDLKNMDWYLAGNCDAQFSDEDFHSCMKALQRFPASVDKSSK